MFTHVAAFSKRAVLLRIAQATPHGGVITYLAAGLDAWVIPLALD